MAPVTVTIPIIAKTMIVYVTMFITLHPFPRTVPREETGKPPAGLFKLQNKPPEQKIHQRFSLGVEEGLDVLPKAADKNHG